MTLGFPGLIGEVVAGSSPALGARTIKVVCPDMKRE
nr:MAG TPA: hypothetical protein [Bacteriophage sp.]